MAPRFFLRVDSERRIRWTEFRELAIVVASVRARRLTIAILFWSVGCDQLAGLHSLDDHDGSTGGRGNGGGSGSIDTKSGGRSSSEGGSGGRRAAGGSTGTGSAAALGGSAASSGGSRNSGGATHDPMSGGSGGLGGALGPGGGPSTDECLGVDSFADVARTLECWEFFEGPDGSAETFTFDEEAGTLTIRPAHGTRFSGGGMAPLIHRQFEGDFVLTLKLRLYGSEEDVAPVLAAYAGGGIFVQRGPFEDERTEISGYSFLKLAASSDQSSGSFPLFYYAGTTSGVAPTIVSMTEKTGTSSAWMGAELRVCRSGSFLRFATRDQDGPDFIGRAGPEPTTNFSGVLTVGLLGELGSQNGLEPTPRVVLDEVRSEAFSGSTAFEQLCPVAE